jgi:hypothetical protein
MNMRIEWPPFPPHDMLDRPATEEDEVCFFDLEEVLDENETLLAVQWALEDELAGCGFLYLTWNGHLSALGDK